MVGDHARDILEIGLVVFTIGRLGSGLGFGTGTIGIGIGLSAGRQGQGTGK
jgi:hypothetical protein